MTGCPAFGISLRRLGVRLKISVRHTAMAGTRFRPAAGSFTRCPRPYSVVPAPCQYSCLYFCLCLYSCPSPDWAFRSARSTLATLPHFWHLISIIPVQLPSLSQSLLPQLGQRFTTLTYNIFAAVTLRLSNAATLFPYAIVSFLPAFSLQSPDILSLFTVCHPKAISSA